MAVTQQSLTLNRSRSEVQGSGSICSAQPSAVFFLDAWLLLSGSHHPKGLRQLLPPHIFQSEKWVHTLTTNMSKGKAREMTLIECTWCSCKEQRFYSQHSVGRPTTSCNSRDLTLSSSLCEGTYSHINIHIQSKCFKC